MFRTENFEAYIAKARLYPQIWRIFMGFLAGLLFFFTSSTIVALSLGFLFGLNPLTVSFAARLQSGETPQLMFIVLVTFIPMATGAVVMALWHERDLRSLLGTRHRFLEFFLKGASIIVFTSALYFGASLLFGGSDLIPHLSLSKWFGFLPWAIPLLFIQITAEELVFRGYLQQQLAARFKGFFWWMILPSLLFSLGHYKPNLDPLLAVMIVFATLVFGVIAADLTRITGSLAAAMGLHFANNFFSLLVVGVPGQLSGIALYHTPFQMDDVEKISGFLALDIAMLFVIWIIARRVVR